MAVAIPSLVIPIAFSARNDRKLFCVVHHLLGARTGLRISRLHHIVARFIDAHIIFILLGCYTCGMAMVTGIRTVGC